MRLLARLDKFRENWARSALQWYRLAVKLGNDGRCSEALEALSKAKDGAPADVQLWMAIGRSYAALEERELAVHALRCAVELAPDDAEAHGYLGLALLDAGADRAALSELERARELGLENTEIHRGLARVFARLGDVGACALAWRKVVTLSPRDMEAQGALGVALSMLGRHEEAIEILEVVALIEPNTAEHISNLGVAHYRSGRLVDAEKFFEMALELEPNEAAGWSNLGAMLTDLGRFDEAREALVKAAAISPDNRDVREALTQVMVRQVEDTRERSVIAGDLSQFAVPDLLQLLKAQQAFGQLIVENTSQQASFTLCAGNLAGDGAKVMQTLKDVMVWKEGQFTFFRREADQAEAVEMLDTSRALLEAACELDEGARAVA
jgi:Flp pilus assembly protein TadD